MLQAYRDEELNRRRYYRALKIGLGFAVASQCVAYAGWWHASSVQRLSLPPQLRYGAMLTSGKIQPWEVYTFAGYIHQQINNWVADGSTDSPRNIQRLSNFLSHEYRSWLLQEHDRHASRFRGRLRNISYVPGSYNNTSVEPIGQRTWRVILDVRLQDYLEGQLFKDIDVRYFLEVIALDTDPETNEWGLVINRQYQLPVRLRSHLAPAA